MNPFQEMYSEIKKRLFENAEVKARIDDLVVIDDFADAMESFSHIYFVGSKVIETIVEIEKDYGALSEEQRIDAAAEILDDLIKFKGWTAPLEAIDNMIFKLLLKAIVEALKEKGILS